MINISIFKKLSKEGRENERQAKVVADTNNLVVETMTRGLPNDIRMDQENKLIDLFKEENEVMEKYYKNNNPAARSFIRAVNSRFKEEYESVKKYAVPTSKILDMPPLKIKELDNKMNELKDGGKSNINMVVNKLNEIIDSYNNVFKNLSDEKIMEKALKNE